MSDSKVERNISIDNSTVNGPVISGDNATVTNYQGNTTNVTALTLSNSQLDKVQKEYATPLKEFLEKFNETIKENSLEPQKIAEIQTDLNEFAKELEDATPTSGITKKESIRGKFFSLAKKSVKYLPKAIQLAASFTPLAPLTPLIGEAAEKIVEAIQQE